MKAPTFRTCENFVTTSGANNRRLGAFGSIEYAEQCGESLRKGTAYCIWQKFRGGWRCIRERTAG
jgi:hypothetical protein